MPRRPPTHRPPRLPTPEARPNAAARGYCSTRWRKLRLLLLAGEPLCRQCRAEGRLTPAVHIDHVTAREQGGTDDPENLQPLCPPCHSRKTAREDGGFGRQKTRLERVP